METDLLYRIFVFVFQVFGSMCALSSSLPTFRKKFLLSSSGYKRKLDAEKRSPDTGKRTGGSEEPIRDGDTVSFFDVEVRLSPRWVGGNIGSTNATKTCHILNAYIFENNNSKVINNTSLDSL
jgi:hypothetical protein